ERLAEQVVEAFCIASPELAVVSRCGCRRLSRYRRQWGWRVVWRWQNYRTVRGEDVRNSHPLCHRPGGDLQGGCSHDDVAALGCRGDCLELGGDRVFRQLTPALGREWGRRGWWVGGRRLAQLGTDGYDGDAEA